VHPVEVGWVMVTVVAVTGSPKGVWLEDEEEDVGLPTAVMHAPTVTLAAVADTDWVNVVDPVYVTVVCPLVGLCTSSDAPVMAAMVPDVPGKVRLVPAAPPSLDGLVDEVEEAADEPPQAARVAAATPRAARPRARPGESRMRRRRRTPAVSRDDWLLSMVIVFPWSFPSVLRLICRRAELDGSSPHSLLRASMGARRAARLAG
jgi:hypothetical protein